jgi:hypothetical protein
VLRGQFASQIAPQSLLQAFLKKYEDGSVEIQNGAVRVSQDGKQTDIRALRIVVKEDATIKTFGPATISQVVR